TRRRGPPPRPGTPRRAAARRPRSDRRCERASAPRVAGTCALLRAPELRLTSPPPPAPSRFFWGREAPLSMEARPTWLRELGVGARRRGALALAGGGGAPRLHAGLDAADVDGPRVLDPAEGDRRVACVEVRSRVRRVLLDERREGLPRLLEAPRVLVLE